MREIVYLDEAREFTASDWAAMLEGLRYVAAKSKELGQAFRKVEESTRGWAKSVRDLREKRRSTCRALTGRRSRGWRRHVRRVKAEGRRHA